MRLHRLLLFLSLVSLVGAGWYEWRERLGVSPSLDSAVSPATSAQVPSLLQALRPVYPFSVIPGGVLNRAELAVELARDVLVRDHYVDFKVPATHLAVMNEDRFAYVSYRKNGRIFWTRKQLRIPKGEVVLTDGSNVARARCGNRLSAVPRDPVSPEPLAPPELSLGPMTPELLRDKRITFAAPPETPAANVTAPPGTFVGSSVPLPVPSFPAPFPITLIPPVITGPPVTGPIPPASSLPPPGGPIGPALPPASTIPEPGNLMLAGFGVFAAGSFVTWQRRKKD